MDSSTRTQAWLLRAGVAAVAAACGMAVQAQPTEAAAQPLDTTTTASAAGPSSLRQAFDTAWARELEAGVARLHLRDHGKATDVSKATAKLRLLTGTEKQELELGPAGDKLDATSSVKVGPGTKAVAVVMIAGKPATARFTLK